MPLPYNLGSPGLCHLTLTSLSQSTGFVKFASIFHVYVTFSTTIQCRFIIHFVLDPHIYHGVYISVRHMSPNIDLIFMVYRFYQIYIKFSSLNHFSTTYNLGSPCLVHTFIMEGTCQTYMCRLSLTSFSQSTGVVKHD